MVNVCNTPNIKRDRVRFANPRHMFQRDDHCLSPSLLLHVFCLGLIALRQVKHTHEEYTAALSTFIQKHKRRIRASPGAEGPSFAASAQQFLFNVVHRVTQAMLPKCPAATGVVLTGGVAFTAIGLLHQVSPIRFKLLIAPLMPFC